MLDIRRRRSCELGVSGKTLFLCETLERRTAAVAHQYRRLMGLLPITNSAVALCHRPFADSQIHLSRHGKNARLVAATDRHPNVQLAELLALCQHFEGRPTDHRAQSRKYASPDDHTRPTCGLPPLCLPVPQRELSPRASSNVLCNMVNPDPRIQEIARGKLYPALRQFRARAAGRA